MTSGVVLVTGAGGFVGSCLIAELRRRRIRVRAVDSNLFGTLTRLSRFPGVDLVAKDYRNLDGDDFAGVESVVHLAALPNDPSGELFGAEVCDEWNGYGVGRFAAQACESGCKRFVFMSTCSVYGAQTDSDQWCDETSDVDPLTAYAKAKLIAERELAALEANGMEVLILRSATLYGFSAVRTRLDLPVNRFCLQAHWHKEVRAVGVNLWRPLVSVVDAARAIAECLELPEMSRKCSVMNLGRTDFNWLLGDVAGIVASQFSVAVREVPLGHDSRSYRVSFRRFEELLPEAIPQMSIEEGVRMLAYVLRSGTFSPQDEWSPRCNVVSGYKSLLASGQLNSDGSRPADFAG